MRFSSDNRAAIITETMKFRSDFGERQKVMNWLGLFERKIFLSLLVIFLRYMDKFVYIPSVKLI
jgi:hypothetical protein